MKCLFSDLVPEEAKLLDSTEFLPLEDNWTSHIVKATGRSKAIEQEKVKEYDIKNTVKALEAVYDKA